ncbi:hypothetical protein ENLAB_14750 [Enterococcus innesii]|uniref:Uncharacterized protein n=1 Tax=Enterococcus innesii TaxID=2839759 RepID=A0ABN6NRZ8_9ENTE|nr:hypothetical protein ENLAB_14750 [Enterococcus innesii]
MTYTLQQELQIDTLAKEKVHSLHEQLNDRKSLLSDSQRDLLVRDLKRYQELLYQCRLNRQIEVR